MATLSAGTCIAWDIGALDSQIQAEALQNPGKNTAPHRVRNKPNNPKIMAKRRTAIAVLLASMLEARIALPVCSRLFQASAEQGSMFVTQHKN